MLSTPWSAPLAKFPRFLIMTVRIPNSIEGWGLRYYAILRLTK